MAKFQITKNVNDPEPAPAKKDAPVAPVKESGK